MASISGWSNNDKYPQPGGVYIVCIAEFEYEQGQIADDRARNDGHETADYTDDK